MVLAGVLVLAFAISFALGVRSSPRDGFDAVSEFGGSESEDRSDEMYSDPPLTSGPRIRVEVLNAAGRAGLARQATNRLRAAGFDVVFMGNAGESGRATSEVLDRGGELDDAREVARALGIQQIRSVPNSALYLDVTVVLGQDWPPAEDPGGSGFGRIFRPDESR